MISHRDARILVCEGFRRIYGWEPTRPIAQCAQAVAFLETGYGDGWSAAIPGADDSNNMGAITAGSSWSGDTFEHRDSYPNDKGENVSYSTKFRRYATPQDGMTDLIRIVYLKRAAVLAAAKRGDTLGFSTELYRSRYYLGFGKTDAERIGNHHKAVSSAIKRMCSALGEQPPHVDVAAPDLDDVEWSRLRALAVRDRIDVGGVLRIDAMRELAGLDPSKPSEPNS